MLRPGPLYFIKEKEREIIKDWLNSGKIKSEDTKG